MVMRLTPVPPTRVELAPEDMPENEPEPPVAELFCPPRANVVVPVAAPKSVVAAEAAEMVSFCEAKTTEGVSTLIELLPVAVASSIADAPETVTAKFDWPMTRGPDTESLPLAVSDS
ncbi:hypothetical protein Acid7E03_41360 [Acidisoma sp. 7E03]